MISDGRLAFCRATMILLAFISRAAGSTDTTSRKSATEKKMFWRVTLSSALKCFSAKDGLHDRLTPLFFTLICIWNRARSVSFKTTVGRVIDRDIIFRDRTYLVFFFLGCVVKFQAREANSCWILAIEFVCFFSFVPSFLFLFLFTFSIVSPLPLLIKLVKPVRRHSKCLKKYILMID